MANLSNYPNPFGWGFYIRRKNYNEDANDIFTQHIFWDKDNKLKMDVTKKTLCGKIRLIELGDHYYSQFETLEQFKEAVFAPENQLYMCKSCVKSFKKYLNELNKKDKKEKK